MSAPASRARLTKLGSATVAVVLLAAAGASAQAQIRMTVQGEGALRRTCPSDDCGVIGRFYGGESVVVYETIDGWSRVSHYYSAGCFDGVSSYVEDGPRGCEVANGIRQGEFAEWTRASVLKAEG